MIANLTLSLLLTLGTFMALGQSVSTKEFHYYYQVAHDFDIHPPELEFGYPWWFDSDSLPVTGIIFLKEDLDIPLEKLNDTAWVAEVSDANAKEIWASSQLKGFPKFCIIPDSSLTHKQVFDFIDNLLSDLGVAKIQFYSNRGSYSILNYNHPPPSDFWFCGDGIWRSQLEIKVNANFDFMIEQEFSNFDSVSKAVFDAYFLNFKKNVNDNEWRYNEWSQENLMKRINDFEQMLLDKAENNQFALIELNTLNQCLSWLGKYRSLKQIDKFGFIGLEIRGYEISIKQTYLSYNEINLGLVTARKQAFSEWNYSQLFANRQFDKLNYIHAQMPDLITDYEDYRWEAQPLVVPVHDPGPPEVPIPEDSEVYKALMLKANEDPVDVKENTIEKDSLN